jgi:hypothetical protein
MIKSSRSAVPSCRLAVAQLQVRCRSAGCSLLTLSCLSVVPPLFPRLALLPPQLLLQFSFCCAAVAVQLLSS